MAVTVEELYRNYGILADAKDNLSPVSLVRELYLFVRGTFAIRWETNIDS